MKEFIEKLKSFNGFVGSLGVLLPGFTFFIGNAPPLFDKIGILVSAISAAFLWFGYNTKSSDKNTIFHVALKYIIASFILIVAYLWMLDKTSVEFTSYETNKSVRYQVGYNIASWNLTTTADSLKKAYKITSNEELFKECQVLKENIPKIWKPFWVDFFGVINILLFCFCSILWSYGWGMLVKTS